MAAARDRMDRSEAALRRSTATAQRAQARVDRAAWESEQHLARQPSPAHGVQIERAKALRKRQAVTAAALAAAEEELAQTHDQMAARRPAQASEHRAIADRARKAALQAREIERQFSD